MADYQRGDWVLGRYRGGDYYFPGLVQEVSEGYVTIGYDDGDLETLPRENVKPYDWWVDNGVAVVGSAETVRRKLAEQQARCGYDVFCANHRFGGMPLEQALKSLRLFGEEVLPSFA